jgi:glycosyl hydrolase family 71
MVVLSLSIAAYMGFEQQYRPVAGSYPSASHSTAEAGRLLRRMGTAGMCNPFPFKPSSVDSLRSSPRKAFAFYFPPFPISIDNQDPSTDYYSYWLKGQRGYQLVDRPIPRAPLKAPNVAQADFQTEIRRAIDVGLDGFIWEYGIATSDARWLRLPQMLAAARAVDPGFKIMLSPDFPTQTGASSNEVAAAIEQVADDPNLFRLGDGRLILAPFAPERQPLSFWVELLQKLDAKGVKATLVPIFLSSGHGYMPEWAKISYGFSTWGNRYASGAAGYAQGAALAHSLKRKYMSPVAFEDVRTKNRAFYESSGSSEMRASFMAAINGRADWISMLTWNDYTESWMSPSLNRGYTVTDVAAYYLQWYKEQAAPTITQDVLYYFQRTQTSEAPAASGVMPAPLKLYAGDPVSNEVEVLAFLTSPGDLTITQGDSTLRMPAPKGVTSFKVPMIPGATPVFSLERSGRTEIRLKSDSAIQNSVTQRDMSYHAGSSMQCPRP